ncbi:hypothetical protein [Streptomyces griseorubiginosus]|uniref:hypothetical protein n=1 Tax=Streptomyces griseorubiginosus TaxID=67304 RepID=UPI0036E44B92
MSEWPTQKQPHRGGHYVCQHCRRKGRTSPIENKGATCVSCGWHKGLDPTPSQNDWFDEEEADKWRRAAVIAATPGGVIMFIIGCVAASPFLIMLGAVGFIGGVTSLVITKVGTVWHGLQEGERLAAWPGVAVGSLFFLFYATIIGIMAFIGSLI